MRLPPLVSYLLYIIAHWPFLETVVMHTELNYCLVESGYKCRNMDMPLAGKNLYVDYTEFIVFTLTSLLGSYVQSFIKSEFPRNHSAPVFKKVYLERILPYRIPNLFLVLHSGGQWGGASRCMVCYQWGYPV